LIIRGGSDVADEVRARLLLQPAVKPECRWREKAERERLLTQVAQDAERALQAVEQARWAART
jgi:hypothetical protein